MNKLIFYTDGACSGNPGPGGPGGYGVINYKKFGHTTKNSYL